MIHFIMSKFIPAAIVGLISLLIDNDYSMAIIVFCLFGIFIIMGDDYVYKNSKK